MRTRLILAAVVLATAVVAIAVLRFALQRPGSQGTETAVPGVTPAVTATPPAPESPSPAPQAAGTTAAATASPSPVAPSPTAATPSPNLLLIENGAIVRRWTVGSGGGPAGLVFGAGYAIDPKFPKPVMLEFELPASAQIDHVSVTLKNATPVTVRVAVGSARGALRELGTIAVPNDDGSSEHSLAAGTSARYLRFTFERPANKAVTVVGVAAYGTPGPAESGALAGTWVSADRADGGDGAMFGDVKGVIPDAPPTKTANIPRLTLVQEGKLAMFVCADRSPPWRGAVSGTVASAPGGEVLRLAGDGRLLVGHVGGRSLILLRSTKPVASCAESDAGRGPAVLALVRNGDDQPPELDPAIVPGYRYHRALPMLLDSVRLSRAGFVVLDGDCTPSDDLSQAQQRLLLAWVQSGRKLILRDADACSSSEYGFVPFPFKTQATGARGASGHVLAIADPSTLGAGPSDAAHFVDTKAYVATDGQQLGDADVMQTRDTHWCGHMFTTNSLGASGWVHAYARYGRGLIIYNGFDRDDIASRVAPAVAIARYEYAQPAQAELPCNARVASAVALYPSVDRKLPAGVATTLRAPLYLTYADKSAASRAVSLAISGDVRYPATVSPSRTTIRSGATAPLTATISLPKGWSGVHGFTVSADGGMSAKAQTSIRIDGSVALANAFAHQRRVRVYGIHFDVDSAHIQPRSEATISQIADVLRANPGWRMRVEGYTDSDGGAAYNQALSLRRAQAVAADLVARYHVAPQRLVAVGYGLTQPVASNATEAGKALNRRVELVRL